ncbi:hypothetical protein [Novosphingobium lindaniclasticum]
MAIFARRRLQTMLDELAPLMDREQSRGLVRRMESKRIEQALPAEMELGLTWAIAKLGPVEIEPEWYSPSYSAKRLPDLFSDYLIPGQETIIEITALSDAVLPADEGMRNACGKLSEEVGKLRRGAGRHLSYYFYEETVRIGWDSIRRVCVPPKLVVSDTIRTQLFHWIKGQDRKDGDKLQLVDGMLKVVLTWHDRVQSRYNFSTSMPPEIRHISDNYIFNKLGEKAKQLRNVHFKGIRCVILADVGSTALRRFDNSDYTNRVYNGSQIADHFLSSREDAGIDVIAIITPNRRNWGLAGYRDTIEWKIGLFCRPCANIDPTGFERLAETLPPPRREGYQSRQLHEQSVFVPTAKGRYLSTNVSWRKGDKSEIKFSARAFLDLLAGRITPEQAKRVFDSSAGTVVKAHLDRGETIADLRLEPSGPDDDDDHIVITFSDDPAARELKASE